MRERIWTPSQLGQYLKEEMDDNEQLAHILIQGELSNYKCYPSGHHYFTLKDAQGALRCVMFRQQAHSLRFTPEQGMQVLAAGRVTVYPRDGQYQLYCSRLVPDGAGDLHMALEQLKKRLFQAGLFAPEHKKPLPKIPNRVGLVTSPEGAAVWDMIRILGARWPMAQVTVIPVRVQGTEAPGEIVRAIQWANAHQAADLLIVGRGGGSLEDLWAFQEEAVAYGIYHSTLPIISAVGHEPDVTVADLVADVRASTPSNGAELAVPDQQEMRGYLQSLQNRLIRSVAGLLERARHRVERLERSRGMTNPRTCLEEKRILLDQLAQRLGQPIISRLIKSRMELTGLAASLDALSPLKVLGRGYALVEGADGTVIGSVEQVEEGEEMTVLLADGTLLCTLQKKEAIPPSLGGPKRRKGLDKSL